MMRRPNVSPMMVLPVLLMCSAAMAIPAPDGNSVLILDTTVSGGAGSREAVEAAGLGFTPVVVNAATWGATTAAEFASYRAIILGDPTCVGDPSPLAPAEANQAVWGPEITGNVIINVTDPVFHNGQGGQQVTNSAINFAADAATTGAYISLSCYYFTVAEATPVTVPVLQPFGNFDVFGQLGGCPANSHIVAVHPALAGLTDASLSNWSCSSHGGFLTWDPAFSVLVITLDLPSPFVASDGTTGLPYFVARGEELIPIACGDGEVVGDEECDDGQQCGPFGSSAYNTTCTDDDDCVGVVGSDGCATRDGDGCEANCRFPEVVMEPVDLDIKPGSCPNSFNRNSHGVLPVALVGTDAFDVTQIDLASIQLCRADGGGGCVAPHEGPPGPHSVFDDTATPFGGDLCNCHELTGDGITDLNMKFKTDALVAALSMGDFSPGALVELTVSGQTLDGIPFSASDCVRLVPPGSPPGLLAVIQPGIGQAQAWIDISPLDDQLDSGGFGDFERTFPQSTVSTLEAPATLATPNRAVGKQFVGWKLDGVFESTDFTFGVTVEGTSQTIEAVYRLPGDIIADDSVNLVDFAQFANCYGQNAPTASCAAEFHAASDLNRDGKVDLLDFSIFALNFGG